MTPARIGIICALPEETSAFSISRLTIGDIVSLKDNVILAVSGAGWAAAAAMAKNLADKKVSVLVSWGFAGSVSSEADQCQLLLPKDIVTEKQNYSVDENLWQQCNDALSHKMKICDGSIFTAPVILRSAVQKKDVLERFKVQSVDMESAAIASVAKQMGIEMLVIKTVTDRSSESIPHYIDTDTNLIDLLYGIFRHPSSLASVCRLGLGYRRALKSLSEAKLLIGSRARHLPI